jgi:hypothetical protein
MRFFLSGKYVLFYGRPDRSVEATEAQMSARWKQRPEGSTWGDWGDDD